MFNFFFSMLALQFFWISFVLSLANIWVKQFIFTLHIRWKCMLRVARAPRTHMFSSVAIHFLLTDGRGRKRRKIKETYRIRSKSIFIVYRNFRFRSFFELLASRFQISNLPEGNERYNWLFNIIDVCLYFDSSLLFSYSKWSKHKHSVVKLSDWSGLFCFGRNSIVFFLLKRKGFWLVIGIKLISVIPGIFTEIESVCSERNNVLVISFLFFLHERVLILIKLTHSSLCTKRTNCTNKR